MIKNTHNGRSRLLAEVHRDRRSRWRVPYRVHEKVVDDLPQSSGITDHEQRLVGIESDRPIRLLQFDGSDCRLNHLAEVDQLVGKRSFTVETSEYEEVLDKRAHSVRIDPDVAHRSSEVLWPVARPSIEHLGVSADGREWCAQLVRGVRQETPQAFF